MNKYKFLKEEDLSPSSKYPHITGIIRAEIECLIARIEGGE